MRRRFSAHFGSFGRGGCSIGPGLWHGAGMNTEHPTSVATPGGKIPNCASASARMNQHQSTSSSISINQNQSAWSNSCTFLIILCCTFGSIKLTLLFCFLQIWFVLRLLLKCEKGASSSSSGSSSAQIKEFPADAGDCLRISRIKKHQNFSTHH